MVKCPSGVASPDVLHFVNDNADRFLHGSRRLRRWPAADARTIMRTIRVKLVLAFLLVITVCLVPTSAAAAYVIRNYQRQDALERLSNFGETVAGAALTPRLSGLTPAEIVNVFADQRGSNT